MQALTLLTLAAASIASPVAHNNELSQRTSGPSVTIKNGTVVGSSLLGIDSFKGIPFAKPPVGPLRLKPPQTIDQSFGTIQAINYGPGCIQTIAQVDTSNLVGDALAAVLNNPLLDTILMESEDCLTINVQRPAGTNATSKLPVAVWIYGGGFAFGATSTYDASRIVARSVELAAPIVYVSMNYRLNGYGFLPGKEVKKDGSTNLGLRDQRKALEWVSQNIAAFGGDPDKVTIWGESAGAISVFDQTIINGGQNTFEGKQLFRGAIMNSGSVTPTRDVDSPKAQGIYDTVVKAAGCDSASDSLACLRDLPADKFTTALEANPSILGYQSVNLAYLPRPDDSDSFFPVSPENVISNGTINAARVPIIIGDQEDEGTLFSLVQANLTTNDDVINYFNTYFFPGTPRGDVSDLVNAYPEDISAGSPFNTGILNNIYPQYKRLAAILGDITFNLIRRGYLANATAAGVPAWTYQNTYLYGTPVLGTAHGLDLLVLYGPLPTTYQSPIKPIDYYISFFNYLDPNKLGAKSAKSSAKSVNWPQWTNKGREMLEFAALNTHLVRDDYREKQYEALLRSSGKLQV